MNNDNDSDVPEALETLVAPHVSSFDYFLDQGLADIVDKIEPTEILHPLTKARLSLWFENVEVGKPMKDLTNERDERQWPRECRERGETYRAPMQVDLCRRIGDGPVERMKRRLGYLPIMVKSSHCHLRNLTRAEHIKQKEERNEFGGYFILNGIERIIRLLIVPRRHHIMALKRSAFTKRGPTYTEYATTMRCVRSDQSAITFRLHYLSDGLVNAAFVIRRQEYFIPIGILLKCFLEASDREIYDKMLSVAEPVAGGAGGKQGVGVRTKDGDQGLAAFIGDRAELILRAPARFTLRTRAQCLAFLGEHFRNVIDCPSRLTNVQAGEELLRQYVLVHLKRPGDKFNVLVAMLQKLMAFVSGACAEDNADALTHHELLLPGHVMQVYFKERLEDYLIKFKGAVLKDLRMHPESTNLHDEAYLKKTLDRLKDFGGQFEYMLATGNLVTRTGLDLSQSTGFTVVAEKLNYYRFLSHFRSVHRGAYFAQLRTTTVRKLLPEGYGFMCPVHTPDGSPCGLLLHLAAQCRVVTDASEDPDGTADDLIEILVTLGMSPLAPGMAAPPLPQYLQVTVDGRVAGAVRAAAAPALAAKLRRLKGASLAKFEGRPVTAALQVPGVKVDLAAVPRDLEVALVPYAHGGTFPGLFLFSQPSRVARPVIALDGGHTELVGSLEQVWMDIRCPDGESGGSEVLSYTHEDTTPTTMLSIVASLTPWSDFNQSPRNMYQCQMGKQTMAIPLHSHAHRPDTKLYKLQTPQTPIARNARYEPYEVDEYPMGTNAVVAVLSYTGYDMEDAMIINKSSMERGFAHGTLYKNETIDLADRRGRGEGVSTVFGVGAEGGAGGVQGRAAAADSEGQSGERKDSDRIDVDGLPHIGATVRPDESYCSQVDKVTGRVKLSKLKEKEFGWVEQVSLIGTKDKELQKVNIKMRYDRNPVIGDKFSSRHGQKGVLSQLWPDVDMPYSDSTGMRPDLIINPHAFPSRMTIGMLVESMASKAGAMRGEFVESTPFQKAAAHQKGEPYRDPVSVFGEKLVEKGYAYYGTESMISGITGEPFDADIYVGLVYYQRLRHMVSDKFQVRATGPVNQLTRQPIKGRKHGGGIRFGEMERDSLLAHGAAYLLHDRLYTCSDYHVTDVCTKCGSLLSAAAQPTISLPGSSGPQSGGGRPVVSCMSCETGEGVERLAVPYVFKYLASELAAMNIKLSVAVR